MKKILLFVSLFGVVFTGCSKQSARSLEDLEGIVRNAFDRNQPQAIVDAIYFKGADPEIKDMMGGFIRSMDLSKVPLVDLQVYEFSKYQPESDLPGSINGVELVWLVEPTHWVVAKASNKDEDGLGASFTFDLAAADIGGTWWFVGVTPAEDSGADEGIQVPGLTDMNVTVVAFTEEGNVVDFVQIHPEDGIVQIDFSAPDDGSSIFVVAVGPAVHPELPTEMVFSSRKAEGYMGKVTVEVENGQIYSISGNSASSNNPLTVEDYLWVRDQLESGEYQHSDRVLIVTE